MLRFRRDIPWEGILHNQLLPHQQGLNKNVFYDNFLSPQTVDLYNTFAPGFKWYLNRASDNIPGITWQTASDDLAFGANGLTFVSHYDSGVPRITKGSSLATLGFNPVNNSTVGLLIAPIGGYFEAQMSFSPIYPDICDQSVAFWLAGADMGALVHTGKINNNLHYTEVDILEMLGVSCSALGAAISPLGATISPNMAVHEWLNGRIRLTAGGIQNLGTFDYREFHKYGFLWKTIAQNDGKHGVYQWYVDDNVINTLNYCSGGSYSSSETQSGFNVVLQTGKDWTLNIKQVTVWQ